MSSVIDERVVQMSFDNDQFEKGVSQTIKSLNKLDKTLVDTADGEYFANIEERITKVEQAFSKTGMVINGILLTIGQTITQYISKGLSALSQGIVNGLGEYQTQMEATQTILANVKDEGKGIADVTAALDELNTYADKTIYNFTEMTRNIGMFTAAGANLDTSVNTIKGLANAAALVGANATTAARAWYQVSQAMAAGSFKLMDWRSLEISNIAGEGFKSVLTEVARKDGLAVAKMIDNGTALRDTLKDGWLTAERFAEAMAILTGEWTKEDYLARGYTEEQYQLLDALAQEAVNAATKVKSFTQLIDTTKEAIGSGWAVTFRTLIGDFEKAKTLFTRISVTLNSIIDKVSDYRNHLIDFIWNTRDNDFGSAYNNFKETIDNILAIFSTFIGAIRAGFHNIFDWAELRKNLSKFAMGARNITRSLVLNTSRDKTFAEENAAREEAGDSLLVANETNKPNVWDLDAVNENITKLIKVFRGLFAGVDIILRTIGDTIDWLLQQIPGIGDFYKNLKDGNLGLLDNLANIADKITMVRDMIVDLNLIPNILNLVKQSIIDIIKTNPLINGLVKTLDHIERVIKAFIEKLKEINISPFNILVGAIKAIGGVIAGIFYGISEAISNIIQFFTGKSDFSFLDAIGKEIGIFIVLLGELGKGTISVADFFEYYKQKVIGAFEAIYNSPFVQGIVNFFVGAWETIKNFWTNFIDMINTVGTYLSDFYSEYFGDSEFDITKIGIFGAIAAIGFMLYKLLNDVEGWASIGGRIADVLNAIATKTNSEALLNIAYAIGIFAASVFVLSLIPTDKLMDTVSMLLAVMIMLMGVFAVLQGTFDALEKLKTAVKPVEQIFLNLSKGLQRLMQRAGTSMVLEAIGDAFLKIAGALIAMGLAFQFMPEAMEKAVKVLTGIGIALAAIMIVLTIFTNSGMKGAKGFSDTSELLNLGITSFLGAMSQAARMVALSAIIEAFGDVIIKLAAALAIITYVADEKSFGIAIATLIGMVALISLLLVGLYKMSSNMALVEFGQLAGLALVFLAFAGAVAVLGIVTAILSNIKILPLIVAAVAVAGLVIALGFAIKLATKFINADSAATFLALAAIFLALGAAFAAVIYASSLIQNDMQIKALTIAVISMGVLMLEVIGLMAILKVVSVDYGIILSLAVVIGAIALSFLAIGQALSMLNGVKLSPLTIASLLGMMLILNALIMEVVAVGVAAAVAEAIIPGLGYVVVATIGVVAGFILAIGAMLYLISEAILNFQQAWKNFFDVLVFLSSSGEYFIDTIKNAGQTILTAIPDLFALFISIGVAMGTAIAALIMGIKMTVQGIVLNVCTMILEIIVMVSDWINNNQQLILTAFSKLWSAIINLAIIALKFALQDVLPTLLTIIFNVFSLPLIMRIVSSIWNLIGIALENLGIMLKSTGIPFFEMLGDLWIGIGQAAQVAADAVNQAVDWMNNVLGSVLDWLGELVGGIDSVTASVDQLTNTCSFGSDAINDSMLSMTDSVWTAVDKMTEKTNALSEVNTNATNQLVNNSEKYSTAKEAEAEVVSKTTGFEIETLADGATSMLGIDSDLMGDMTGLFEDGFQLNLDNQDTFWSAFLNDEEYYGGEFNKATGGYLLKNTDLLSQYYGEYSDIAGDYYDKMAQYSVMMSSAADNSARQAASKWKKENVDPIVEELKTLGYTTKDLAQDGIDWELTPKTKGKQQEAFDSWTGLFEGIDTYMKNYKPSEVDTSMFTPDFGTSGSGTDTSALEKELKDRNDTIGKYDSEIQPKDLTPTIDLDSLKNEVNQANGIVTGSLLAAQNAAIGDYINQDSELNPFLKDRWQNTYNFTQNNYSPKALSRIDIYRQTQNQLRLSRGF